MSYSEAAFYWVEKESDAGVAFIILTTLFGILRLLTRWARDNVPVGWDDYIIIPAFFVIIALCILAIGMFYHFQ